MKNNSTLLKFIYFAIKREGSRITSTPVQQEYEFYDFFSHFSAQQLSLRPSERQRKKRWKIEIYAWA